MQKLVFFDLDGTLIDNPSSEKLYFLWLLLHGYIGIKQILRALKFTIKWFNKFKSEILVKNKAYLYQLPVKKITKNAQQFTITKLLPRLRPYIVQRLIQHQTAGDIIVLLTGSPKFIADVFANHLGINEIQATELMCLDDQFSDLPPLQHPFAKTKPLIAQKICAKYNIAIGDSIAYTNSIHDLALMESVGKAIAVTPDNKLRHIALQKNWEIIEKPILRLPGQAG